MACAAAAVRQKYILNWDFKLSLMAITLLNFFTSLTYTDFQTTLIRRRIADDLRVAACATKWTESKLPMRAILIAMVKLEILS